MYSTKDKLPHQMINSRIHYTSWSIIGADQPQSVGGCYYNIGANKHRGPISITIYCLIGIEIPTRMVTRSSYIFNGKFAILDKLVPIFKQHGPEYSRKIKTYSCCLFTNEHIGGDGERLLHRWATMTTCHYLWTATANICMVVVAGDL